MMKMMKIMKIMKIMNNKQQRSFVRVTAVVYLIGI